MIVAGAALMIWGLARNEMPVPLAEPAPAPAARGGRSRTARRRG
jgi:hypothetical protein